MRLIDIDAYFENSELMNTEFSMDSVEHGILYDVANELEFAPYIDIVHCKECKHSKPDIISEDFIVCQRLGTVMQIDGGFCSYGERTNNGT